MKVKSLVNPEKLPPPTEDQESFWLASWLDWAGVFYIHVPNGGLRPYKERIDRLGRRIRYSPIAQKLKRMGVKPGACDYLIFDPPPLLPNVKGVALELKRRGEEATPEQLEFLSQMERRGWFAFWVCGGEAASEKLKELGYGKNLPNLRRRASELQEEVKRVI